MILDGEADALTLLSVSIDDVDLVEGIDYAISGDELRLYLRALLHNSSGGDGDGGRKLNTQVEIVPETNMQLSGLYKSVKMYCTQCEAMG